MVAVLICTGIISNEPFDEGTAHIVYICPQHANTVDAGRASCQFGKGLQVSLVLVMA